MGDVSAALEDLSNERDQLDKQIQAEYDKIVEEEDRVGLVALEARKRLEKLVFQQDHIAKRMHKVQMDSWTQQQAQQRGHREMVSPSPDPHRGELEAAFGTDVGDGGSQGGQSLSSLSSLSMTLVENHEQLKVDDLERLNEIQVRLMVQVADMEISYAECRDAYVKHRKLCELQAMHERLGRYRDQFECCAT